MLAGCQEPRYAADCEQLLAEEKFGEVLVSCDNPLHRSSAHLGLAGFNLLDLATSTQPPGDVNQLLGLTTANITAKRQRLALAAEEVRYPATTGQAFALLISAFLGLAVTITEYLDGDLDGDVTQAEITQATGMTQTTGSALDFSVPGTPYFQVVVGGTPYLVICLDALSPPLCNNLPPGLIKVFDDADGSGKLSDPEPAFSADRSTVAAQLTTANPVNLLVQMGELQFPIVLDPVKVARMENFLGAGDPPPADFSIGVVGYLDLLSLANLVLTASSGATGSGGTEITADINAVRNRLDNGATCFSTLDPAGAALLDLLYTIYTSAPGTVATPVPDPAVFTTFNIISEASATGGGVSIPVDPTVFAFTNPIGFKFLYPTEVPVPSFDVTKATPRIDQAAASFREAFENIPRLAPAAAIAGDGKVSIVELFCVSEQS